MNETTQTFMRDFVQMFIMKYTYTKAEPCIIMCIILGVTIIYPMFSADSCFWLANNRTRISRLTSSAWEIKRKEHHWWRHNGNSARRPLSLPLRCDRATLFIRCIRPDTTDSWGFKAVETFQNVSNIVWAQDKFLTLVCCRVYESYPHLSYQYHAWPSAVRGIAMRRVNKLPYPCQQTMGN